MCSVKMLKWNDTSYEILDFESSYYTIDQNSHFLQAIYNNLTQK